MNLPVIILSTSGFLISLYFALVYNKIIRPDSALVPAFCRLDEQSCGSILATPEARVFRIPNFYLGLGYYVVLLALSFSPALMREILLELRLVSGFTVFVGIVLTDALVRKLKIRCILCFTSHAINLALFIVLLV